MEQVPANRFDNSHFAYNYYLYHKDGKIYYRCRHKPCRARVIWNSKDEPKIINEHNHPNEKKAIEEFKFKHNLRKRAISEDTDFNIIYSEEKAKNEEVASRIPFNSALRMIMRRARLTDIPPKPQSLAEINNTMQESRYFERYGVELGPEKRVMYGGYIDVKNDEGVAFWISPTLCEITKERKQIQLITESTSSIVPSVGGSKQLFTVLIEIENMISPLIFALMDKKTVASYYSLFSRIRDKMFVPYNIEVVLISVDYEAAIRQAVKKIFPTANVCGNWFHFARAILKKGNQLGLVTSSMIHIPEEVEKALRMAMTLPLLPKTKFEEGVRAICSNVIIKDHQFHSAVQVFYSYLIKTWKQNNISVLHLRHGVEPFHRSLIQLTEGQTKNIWMFIRCLQKIEQAMSLDILKLCGKNDARFPGQSERTRRLAETISMAQENLKKYDDVWTFLETVGHMMWRPSEIFEMNEEDENEEQEAKQQNVQQEGEEMSEDCEEQVEIEIGSKVTVEIVKQMERDSNTTSAEINQRMCLNCLVEVATYACVPCGHLSVCHACQQETVVKKTCPMCESRCDLVIFVH